MGWEPASDPRLSGMEFKRTSQFVRVRCHCFVIPKGGGGVRRWEARCPSVREALQQVSEHTHAYLTRRDAQTAAHQAALARRDAKLQRMLGVLPQITESSTL